MWNNDNTKKYPRAKKYARDRERGSAEVLNCFPGPPKDLGLRTGHRRSEEGQRSLGLKDVGTEVVTQLHSRGAPRGPADLCGRIAVSIMEMNGSIKVRFIAVARGSIFG